MYKKTGLLLSMLVLSITLIGVGCNTTTSDNIPNAPVQDYKNISYSIEGTDVLLTNGEAETQIEVDSSSTIKTKIFEAVTEGDMNNDGLLDTAILFTQEHGGSGTFFYVALAIQTENGYMGTNAVLLGDRIAPQSANIQNSLLIVNYVDREIEEDFSIQPSVGKSMYLQYSNDTLISRPEAIQVTDPYPHKEITSPLTITGQARGSWFFEASFPIVLTNWDGVIIAEGYATAEDDWMTDQLVSFTARLIFDKPMYKNNGTLILRKDNPSGLPEHDAAYEIPIIFQ